MGSELETVSGTAGSVRVRTKTMTIVKTKIIGRVRVRNWDRGREREEERVAAWVNSIPTTSGRYDVQGVIPVVGLSSNAAPLFCYFAARTHDVTPKKRR